MFSKITFATIIKNKEGEAIIEVPPTLGVVGAIAALVTECTITVERD